MLPEDTWDCSVNILPLLQVAAAADCQQNLNSIQLLNGPQTTEYSLNTFSVSKAKSGDAQYPDERSLTGWSRYHHGLGAPKENSPRRIISGGFEVTNTTAALYKQGSVTVYSAPQTRSTLLEHLSDQDLGTRVGLVENFVQPPSTLAQAQSLRNAVTWSAEDGCYIPIRLNINDMQFQPQTNNVMCFRPLDQASVNIAYDAADTGMCTYFTVTDGRLIPSITRTQLLDQSGAYFSGLSYQTTLQLNVRLLVEVAPSATSPLVTLSSPSAAYNLAALELYKATVQELAPGCPVGMNAKGDFWRNALGAIGSVASFLAPAINYFLPGVGTGVGALGALAQGYGRSKPKPKKTVVVETGKKKASPKARLAIMPLKKKH